MSGTSATEVSSLNGPISTANIHLARIREVVSSAEGCTSQPELHSLKAKLDIHLGCLTQEIAAVEEVVYGWNGTKRQAGMQIIDTLNDEVESVDAAWRRAVRLARHNCSAAEEDDRRALLGHKSELAAEEAKRKHQLSALAVAQAETRRLEQAHAAMTAQLELAAATNQALEETSSTLAETLHESKDYGSTMKRSKGLLTRLARRDVTDKLIVALGVLVFALAVAFVLKRRIGLRLSWIISWFSWLW